MRSFSLVREWCRVRSPRRCGRAEWAGGVREPGRTPWPTTSPLKMYLREWWRRMGSRVAILRYAETGERRSPGESSMALGYEGYSGTGRSTGHTAAGQARSLAPLSLSRYDALQSAVCVCSYPPVGTTSHAPTRDQQDWVYFSFFLFSEFCGTFLC